MRTPAEATPSAGVSPPVSAEPRDQRLAFIAVGVAVAIITALAIHRLRDFPSPLSWRAAFAGVLSVLPQTGWAAIKVWSFLGIGTETGYADWGQLISFAHNWIPSLSIYWYMVVFPGMALVLFVLGWNLVGDALRDIMDPRMRGRGA